MSATHPSKTDQVPITPMAPPAESRIDPGTLLELDLLLEKGVAEGTWNWSRLRLSEDRYLMGERFAGGGMGSVYLATDKVLGRKVAIKVLHTALHKDPQAVVRFFQEARIHAQFHHPGIPPLHDIGRLPDGRPYIAMKFIRGRTLADRWADEPPAGRWDHYRRLFHQVCEVVRYAHAKGVVHRDLTPRNVLVSERGRVQVVDWGLAKVLSSLPPRAGDGTGEDDTTLTTVPNLSKTDEAMALGTPASMAPELVDGTKQASERNDVFGLGAILCFILTGTPPFDGGLTTVIRNLKASDLTRAFGRLDECGGPKDLVELAKDCLAPNPADRPAVSEVQRRTGVGSPTQRSWWDRLFGRK